MKPIRVLLADDHALLRAGIRALLQGVPGIEVVAEANDGREALELLKTHHVHVLVSDIGMAGMNGLEAAARVAKEFSHVRVIILSMHSSEEYVSQALKAGASGYLLKDSVPAELELAIRAVAKGETYLSPAVSKHVVSGYMQRLSGAADPLDALTPRQREILQLIAEGKTTKEIAKILKIGIKTAETHRAQLMERLDIHDVAGLVRYAIRVGLVEPDR
ncbi:MAG TPA: response regulator transcription factor [Gemmataceae bacterium]|nr:response regulator transcription factor [Gemmataceae bacterium]